MVDTLRTSSHRRKTGRRPERDPGPPKKRGLILRNPRCFPSLTPSPLLTNCRTGCLTGWVLCAAQGNTAPHFPLRGSSKPLGGDVTDFDCILSLSGGIEAFSADLPRSPLVPLSGTHYTLRPCTELLAAQKSSDAVTVKERTTERSLHAYVAGTQTEITLRACPVTL